MLISTQFTLNEGLQLVMKIPGFFNSMQTMVKNPKTKKNGLKTQFNGYKTILHTCIIGIELIKMTLYKKLKVNIADK